MKEEERARRLSLVVCSFASRCISKTSNYVIIKYGDYHLIPNGHQAQLRCQNRVLVKTQALFNMVYRQNRVLFNMVYHTSYLQYRTSAMTELELFLTEDVDMADS